MISCDPSLLRRRELARKTHRPKRKQLSIRHSLFWLSFSIASSAYYVLLLSLLGPERSLFSRPPCVSVSPFKDVGLHVFGQVHLVHVQSLVSRKYINVYSRSVRETILRRFSCSVCFTDLQISAVGIISIAIIINQKFYKWSNFISWELISTPQVLMLIGVGVLLIAVIGLCGVLRDSGCLLTLVNYISNRLSDRVIVTYYVSCQERTLVVPNTIMPCYFCSFLFCLRSSWLESWYCLELYITCTETLNNMHWTKWIVQCLCTIKPMRRLPHGTCYRPT